MNENKSEMSNEIKSLYNKARIKCKKLKVPFSPSCEPIEIKDFGGKDNVVNYIVQDCIFWKKSYEEDMLSGVY